MTGHPTSNSAAIERHFGPIGWLRGNGTFALQLLRPFVFGWVIQLQDGTLILTFVCGRRAKANQDGWICLRCWNTGSPQDLYCPCCHEPRP